MAKQIAKLLRADLNATSDLALIAKMLERKGRANDTILAHITEREAQLLKKMGGAGTVNPETGLLEFYDGADYASFEPTTTNYGAFGEAPITEVSSLPVTPVTVDNQAPATVAGYEQFAPTATQYGAFGEAPTGTAEAPAAGQPSELFSGSGLTQSGRGETGITPGATYGLRATPAQTAALYQPQITDYRPGYGVTDTVTPGAAVPPEPKTAAEKSFFDKLSTDQLVRLGLAGGLGLYGAQQSKKAAAQGQAAAEEQKAIGAPYQAKGAELQRAAAAGELTPAGQQSMQALQARLAQGVEARGGVGAAQAAAQLEAYRQQLLQGQFDYGIKVSQIGDSIALGAIRTGMQADQQLNQANTAFYTNLAMISAGIPMRTA